MSMSVNLALHRTVAPASRQILANILSGPKALVRSMPDLGHAARSALAFGVCHVQGQPYSFEHQSAEGVIPL